jgi:hypothetical protein
MLWRQIRLAPIAVVIAVSSAAIAIAHHSSSSGSAVDGYVDRGHYLLSMGHGHYQETDAQTFAKLLRNERIVGGCLIVFFASAVWIGFKMRRLGLANFAKDIPVSPQTLHPSLDELQAGSRKE